ncbi:MAG: deoxyribodipyrimidine photo-lyase [Thermomicrobiales bacterium]|nr:deoxyribodipyrimidine photo-lyase [Thermomicrobiales bacterium]
MQPSIQVVLFRRDLRCDDHEPLARAAGRGPVLPLYIADPATVGAPEFDARHWTFIRASLIELRRRLFTMGQPLIVRIGDEITVLDELHRQTPFKRIWMHEEAATERMIDRDLALSSWAKTRKVKIEAVPANGVAGGADDRDDWDADWDAAMRAPVATAPARIRPVPGVEPGPIPDHADLGLDPDRCLGCRRGGEQVAWRMLTAFLNRRVGADGTADPTIGDDPGSGISPYLTWGNLSLRQAVQASRRRLAEVRDLSRERRGGTPAMLATFEARLQRRSRILQRFADSPSIESIDLNPIYAGLRAHPVDSAPYRAWQTGLTGYPMIDAAMRSLRETGRISYRMRAMLVSFVAFDLWLDWRVPGLHLARLSLDFEPAIHWEHVQIHAGSSERTAIQIYNPTKQGLEGDPDGAFVRTWVPELGRVPVTFIHTPWLLPEAMQRSFGCVIGHHYPAPIVDHAVAAREAHRRMHEARDTSGERDESAAQARHEPMRTPRSRGSRKEKPTQLSFPID